MSSSRSPRLACIGSAASPSLSTMEVAGALGGAPALLSPSSLRLCFVTRSQALALEPLELQLLRESGQGAPSSGPASWRCCGGGGGGGSARFIGRVTSCTLPRSIHSVT